MIDKTTSDAPDLWRRWWLALMALTLVVATGFLVGHGLSSEASQIPPKPSASVTIPSASTPAPILETTTSPAVSPPKPTLGPGLLQMSGSVPSRGSGRFVYATTRGPVLGTKGVLKRFRVAVEQGSGEDVAAFADEVDRVLGDPRSWTGGGQVRLQMVAGSDPADFTVYLATRVTAGDMCARGGTNIRINGVPYTSCRTTGRAILNLDRWRLSSKPYVNAKVPLATYREYVINHEVGHELGHRHEGCPRAGGPAPVMVQQTLTTRGCVPYAWPRRNDRFLTGPAR
jgi:hypothetical protein